MDIIKSKAGSYVYIGLCAKCKLEEDENTIIKEDFAESFKTFSLNMYILFVLSPEKFQFFYDLFSHYNHNFKSEFAKNMEAQKQRALRLFGSDINIKNLLQLEINEQDEDYDTKLLFSHFTWT